MSKLYIYAAISVALMGFSARFYWLSNEVPKLSAALAQSQLATESVVLQLQAQVASTEAAINRSEIYQKAILGVSNENETLRNNLANGTERLHLNATCSEAKVNTPSNSKRVNHTLPRPNAIVTKDNIKGTEISPWSNDFALPQLNPIATEGYFELSDGIQTNAAQYKLAIDTLNYWHDHWSELCSQ